MVANGKCADCAARQGLVQGFAVNGSVSAVVPPIVRDTVESGGQPLDAATRAIMEPRFGESFSAVRVHADARAAEAARSIDAEAYTVGSEIAFAAGRYDPGSEAGRQLLAHELAHVVQQRGAPVAPQRASLSPALGAHEQAADAAAAAVLAGRPPPAQPRSSTQVVARQPATTKPPDAPGYTWVVVDTPMSGPEFCARGLAKGTGRDLDEVRRLVDSGAWHCYGSLSTGGVTEADVKRLEGKPIKFLITGTAARAAQAAAAEDPREAPGVQEALDSPEMQRWFKLRERYHRLQPNLRVPLYLELKPGDDLAVIRAYEILKGLDDTDWAVLNMEVSGVASDWTAATASLEAFRTSDVRTQAQKAVTSRDLDIAIADAEVDVNLVEEKRAVARLNDLGDLYAAIKDYEHPEQTEGVKKGADVRMVEAYLEKAMEQKLKAANFDDLSEFDLAVERLRVVVRREAVKLTLHLLKESEESLVKERERYREREEVVALLNELAAWRRRPSDPSRLVDLLNKHWLLGTSVVLQGALDANYADFLRDILLQSAGAQLTNVALCRKAIRDDEDVVFDFDKVIELTFDQMKIASTSVQAQLIREGRDRPDKRSWARKWLVDRLLTVLSFVPGPIGWAARATQFAVTVNDVQAHFNQQAAAANAGKALASKPEPGGSVVGITLGLLGLLPGPKPRPVLGGKPLVPTPLQVVARDEAPVELQALDQSASEVPTAPPAVPAETPPVAPKPEQPAAAADPVAGPAPAPPTPPPAHVDTPPVAATPESPPVTTDPVAGPAAVAATLTEQEVAALRSTEATLQERRPGLEREWRQQRDVARSTGDRADRAADDATRQRLEDAFDAQQREADRLEAELRALDDELGRVRNRIEREAPPTTQPVHLPRGKLREGEVAEAFGLGPKNNVTVRNPDPTKANFIPDHIDGNPTTVRWGKPYHFREIKDWADMSDTGNLSAMLDYVAQTKGSRLTIYYRSGTYMSEPLRIKIEGLRQTGQVDLIPFVGE